jgi:hypothetical protein
MVWGIARAGTERTAAWELRVAPRGQPEARAVDLETIENVIVMVLDGPSSALELRVEQSDNDGDPVVRNDSGDAIVVQLLRADKVIEVPLASDESWHFHPE